jgi:hypothetical protein
VNHNIQQIVYISVASKDFSDNELIEMLAEFRKSNEKTKISGILVYFNGSFCQVFEGPSEKIEQLWKNIQEDKRHNLVTEIINREVADRMFSNWTMAFKVLNLADVESAYGFNQLLMNHKKEKLQDEFKGSLAMSNDIVDMLASYIQS